MKINFLIDLAKHGHLKAAVVYTGFINQHVETLFPTSTPAEVVQPKFVIADSAIEGVNVGSVIAPIPVVLDKVFGEPGDSVKAGTPLAVLIKVPY
ncbi:AAEL013130-PA [Aedes aegypti]|uniref:AAEL013130-PA n=1 Tax=Aedes aegypti TaxID=7159 RepID=Q16K26_AEDAE|nr:AAEL013130-PA [Aedes aegypti]